MSDDLATRLQRLETIEAARGLTMQYAELIDAKHLDDLPSIFADTIVLTMPGRRHDGIDAVTAFYRTTFENDPSGRRHFITNVRVAGAGDDEIALSSYFLFTAGTDGNAILGWGRYRDTFAETNRGLRIASKDIVVEHRGPVDATWGADW